MFAYVPTRVLNGCKCCERGFLAASGRQEFCSRKCQERHFATMRDPAKIAARREYKRLEQSRRRARIRAAR